MTRMLVKGGADETAAVAGARAGMLELNPDPDTLQYRMGRLEEFRAAVAAPTAKPPVMHLQFFGGSLR